MVLDLIFYILGKGHLMLEIKEQLASSFRDPAGFLFRYQGFLLRQINPRYFSDYDHLMQSGLYSALRQSKRLISHEEVSSELALNENARVIKPEVIPFISYPYEWCFSQLKDAALLTLEIQKKALEHGMTLKDASSYNIQFLQGQAIFIDTLSFTKYKEGEPWQPYLQFCQHFLAPLMLMSYKDIRLNQLLKVYIDGIPLDLASSLLPTLTKFILSPALHIHVHAKLQKKYQNTKDISRKSRQFNLKTLSRFIDSLIQCVNKLTWEVQRDSQWYSYYVDNHNYAPTTFTEKEKIIDEWVRSISPPSLWDLGANRGRFSSIASKYCKQVIAWDIDPSCVESLYLNSRKQSSPLLSLTIDLTNPSPSLGFDNQERLSFKERGPVDAILALGLIHHLALVNNVPLAKLALFFSELTKYLIIEFVPKEDSQVQKLLATREDIFNMYSLAEFKREFGHYFNIINEHSLQLSERTLFLMQIKR